jgi:hypothetical protein
MMEVNLPVNVKVSKDKDNGWNAVVIRRSEEKEYPVLSLRGLTPSDLYVKFGLKVEEDESETPELDAKTQLEAALQKASTKTNYTATEVQNILLDAYNALGGKEVDKETTTDGDE